LSFSAGPDSSPSVDTADVRRKSKAIGRRGGLAGRALPFLGYLGLQALIIVGLPTPRFIDSPSYLQLDFTGHGARLWVVPLFYWLLRYDSLRIAGQVILAAVAWWVLARTASSLMVDRRARLGVQLALLILGLVGPVASWNSTILSESVAISLTALLVAAWIYFSQAPSLGRAAPAVLVTALWAFTRPDLTVMVAAIALLMLFAVLRSTRRVLSIAVTGALAGVFVLGILSISHNDQVRSLNLASIFAEKILPVHSRTAWFVQRGMPYDLTVARAAGVYPPTALANDPEFARWLLSDGEHSYLVFVLQHPGYTLLGPLPYLSGERTSLFEPTPVNSTQPYPVASMLSPTANYGRHREVLPSVIQGLWFEQGQIGDVILLAVLAIGVNVEARRRTGRDRRLVIPTCIVGLVLVHHYFLWLSSAPPELDRQAITQAVALRIALWIGLVCGVDRLLVGRPRQGRHVRTGAGDAATRPQ
jgi:hypothetical protein